MFILLQLHWSYLSQVSHMGWIRHSLNPESTVSFNQEFQVDGDDRVPSGFWTPFPVDQGESLVTDRSIGSAAVQVPPAAPAVPAQPA